MSYAGAVVIAVLMTLLVTSLLLVRRSERLREERMMKAKRLRVLDRRSTAGRWVITRVESVDRDPGLLAALYKSLRLDLEAIVRLDPRHGEAADEVKKTADREKQLQAESAVAREGSGGASVNRSLMAIPALDSEQRISDVRSALHDAVILLRSLLQSREIRPAQYEKAMDRLKVLSLYAELNLLLMRVERAAERKDRTAVLVHYRKARDLLATSSLPPAEKEYALAEIRAHQDRRFEKLEAQEAEMVASLVREAGEDQDPGDEYRLRDLL